MSDNHNPRRARTDRTMRKNRIGRVRLMLVASVAVLAGIAVTQVISASAGTGAASAPPVANPFAAYVPPSGPELPLATILGTARSTSERADVPSPSAVSVAQGTLREAMLSVNPEVTLPTAPGGGQEAWLNSTVDLVSMRGSFTLHDAHVPHGDPAPTGSVLDLVIDAHTGEIVGRALTATEPGMQRLDLLPAESSGAGIASATSTSKGATGPLKGRIGLTAGRYSVAGHAGVIAGRLYAAGGPAPGRSRPAQGFGVLVVRAGSPLSHAHPLAATKTGVGGWFAIHVGPGSYLLAGELPSGQFCPARRVLVRAGQSTRATLICSVR